MKINKKTKRFFLLTFIVLVMVSCWDPSDYENIYIEPIHQSWVFPIVKSSITFKEIVERSGSNTTVETDPETGVFFMVVRDTVNIGDSNDQFSVVGTSFNHEFTVPGGLIPGFGTFQTTETLNNFYEIVAGQEVKTVTFYRDANNPKGDMELNIVNNFHHPISGSLTIISLKNNAGQSYSRNFYLGGFGSNSTDTRPLSDYTLDLYNSSDQTYNRFLVQVDFTITENTAITDYSGGLSISIDLIDPEFEIITGKFNKDFSISDQAFSISAFNSTILAEQYFADPSFTLNFENSYGTPLSLAFSSFEAINNQNEVIPIINIGAIGPNDLNITGNNIINYNINPNDPPALTALVLDANNSNIDQVFKKAPNRLRFGADFTIGDETNNHSYFIKRNSLVSLITDIVIPLNGWATTHLLGDTLMDVSWPEINDSTWLTEDFRITLLFKVTNEIPLNFRFKAICLNEVDGVIEEGYNLVFSQDVDPIDGTVALANSAVVDDNGIATGPSSSYLSISLTKEEYDQIVDSQHLLLFYRLSTGGQAEQVIKVLSSNKMTINLSLHFSGTINPNDFINGD